VVARRETQNGAGINSTAKIAAYRNIRTEAEADGLFKCRQELFGILSVRADRAGATARG